MRTKCQAGQDVESDTLPPLGRMSGFQDHVFACTRIASKQGQNRAAWNPGGTPSKKDLRAEPRKSLVSLVELRGIEPLTSALRTQRSPS